MHCVKCIHQSPRRNQVYDHNIIDEVAVLAWSERQDRRMLGYSYPVHPVSRMMGTSQDFTLVHYAGHVKTKNGADKVRYQLIVADKASL